ncbi:MAG TPA: nucleotidyl transferase [Ignisphaera aggregans]|uniref:Nucleotidyl transferase n=1 Tax=Ignisphaera aggregans TaxID=334771 RepID=A0A832YWX7_9CREN|nr:nucleotidyl transferase [Ignisphaera aggregans]
MIGIVLAAGRGRRLQPFTETRPKPLLPVLDKPLIAKPLEMLRNLGISRVVVVVSYMKDALMSAVKALANEIGIDVVFVDQREELGTAHAVKAVLRDYEEDAVIIHGDLYVDPDYVARVLKPLIKERKHDMVVVAARVDDIRRFGKLIVSGDRVLEIVEKPEECGAGLANTGIYIVSVPVLKLVEFVERSPRGEYEFTDVVRLAHRHGFEVRYVEIESRSWMDVGYPWHIIEVNRLELEKRATRVLRGDVEPYVTVKGPVIVDEGAEIRSGSYIVGPVYIGRDVEIGPNAYIRPYSVILQGSRIGFSVEVKESVVMEYVHASHLSYIGDSVVGEHTNLGAGTVLANLRFDNKNVKVTVEGERIDTGRRKLGALVGGYVKTGVNVSIMPGVKIGSYSVIYPGVTVYRDVPPRTVVKDIWR